MRRATPADPGVLPVGLRGLARHERCAAELPAAQVARSMSPEAVLAAWRAQAGRRRRDRPCLHTLDTLAPALDVSRLAWGVTGGAGFALASGIDVLREDSDLDLLLRSASPADAAALRDIAALLPGQPARVDVQVETPAGGFALLEWTRTGGRVLLKTAAGPVLSDDPWNSAIRPEPGPHPESTEPRTPPA